MVNKVENIITVINYIENNLTEKLNLSSIAMGVGYSKYHLHRMFVETVGLSIHDYVQRRQLTESAKLLVFSDKSILEISLLNLFYPKEFCSLIVYSASQPANCLIIV